MDTVSAILDAASALLEAEGPDALTARAVCEAAGIKAPTLYHHFGGKDGLVQALLARGMADFMQKKRLPPASADPLDLLKSGWDIAVGFALKRPGLWRLHVQHALTHPELFAEPYALVQSRIQRLVDLGIFDGPVDAATRVFWAANQGALALILQGHKAKDVEATSHVLFNAALAQLKRAD